MIHVVKFFVVIAFALWLTTTLTEAAGLRLVEVPADAKGQVLTGAVWSPCAAPAGEVELAGVKLPGVRNCPVVGENLPLVILSHGSGATFDQLYDTAEALADAGFVAAAITHPDTSRDASASGFLSRLAERPIDIKRLIDFMLGAAPMASNIDPRRIGFYGFSMGGFTGLVLIGADPDWATAPAFCEVYQVCEMVLGKKLPPLPSVHDARIKAAVLADPGPIFFNTGAFSAVKTPVQLWASEFGGPRERVNAVDQNLPAAHEFHLVPNSGHLAFVLCPPVMAVKGPELCTDAPGFDRAAFHKQFNADVLRFLRVQLGDQ